MPYFQRHLGGARQNSIEKSSPDSIANNVESTGAAANIVQQATSILQRETAVVPASAPSDSLTDAAPPVSLLKADQIEARADQLRRQAGDLVEGVLSMIFAAGSASPSPAALGPATMSGPSAAGHAPLIKPAGAVKAGNLAKIPFTITNDGPSTIDLAFYSSDLIGDSGFGIPARKVNFVPRLQSLRPQESTTLEALIPIPPQTPAGTYAGLIQATALEYLRAVLTVAVE